MQHPAPTNPRSRRTPRQRVLHQITTLSTQLAQMDTPSPRSPTNSTPPSPPRDHAGNHRGPRPANQTRPTADRGLPTRRRLANTRRRRICTRRQQPSTTRRHGHARRPTTDHRAKPAARTRPPASTLPKDAFADQQFADVARQFISPDGHRALRRPDKLRPYSADAMRLASTIATVANDAKPNTT